MMKRLISALSIFAVLTFFVQPIPAQAAGIALDNNTNGMTLNGGGASWTVSYTTSGSNRYLIVGAIANGSTQTLTGCTYAGVSMTNLASINSTVSAETDYVFGLAAPASGANNIVCSSGGTPTIGIAATSFTGAQQTTAVEASNTSSGVGGTTLTMTTITDNDWLVGFARTTAVMTTGANTTIRGTVSNLNNIDTNAAQTPAGSHSMAFTDGGHNTNGVAVAIMPLAVISVSFNFWQFITAAF